MPSGVAGERSRVVTRQPLTLARRTVTFVGVTTAQSSIHRIFPSWMAALGRPEVVLEGLDLRLHDEPATYRRVIERIKADPDALGGVVTSHKVDLFAAAHDLFDELNALATALGEISSISKGRVVWWAPPGIRSASVKHSTHCLVFAISAARAARSCASARAVRPHRSQPISPGCEARTGRLGSSS
jgi:hypothetical protein